MSGAKAARVITGRAVLIGMLLFFGVIFAVNGVFVYVALDSFPGLSTEQPYQAGLDYDDTLAQAAAQAQRGWQSRLDADGRDVSVTLTGRDGNPLQGLTVTVDLSRPVGDDLDIVVALKEVEPGLYRAPAPLPYAGRWVAEIKARDRDGAAYRMIHTLVIAP